MDNHFDRRERTIYVWMLERNVTDDQLYSLFSRIGPIEKLIFKEYADGTPQHCLIVFRYVDSVLTAMSTLQGAELNGRPISLRPLRESTHAVLMPPSTMYPTSGSSPKERTTTVTSLDGALSEHSDDFKKPRANWDAVSSAGSASSCVWTMADAHDAGVEKMTIDNDKRCGGTVGSRSSYSSVCSSPPHSISPPAAIHGSLRTKPWRPSRGPIPAPLLTQGGAPRYFKDDYGSGGYGSGVAHANLVTPHNAGTTAPPQQPRSLLSQMIPPSPGYGISPSPFNHSSFFGGMGGVAPCSPRPLIPELATGGAGYRAASGAMRAAPHGVFSPTAAPEEVVWRQQQHVAPPVSLMSPPCTAGGRSWFEYGACSVPQAYRGSATDAQLSPQGAAPTPLSLGGMLPPNSPPIGQYTRAMFDFSDVSATLPSRFRPSSHHAMAPPPSARPPMPAAFTGRCAPRAPRSAATFGANPAPAFTHNANHNSPVAWPEYRAFGARF
ncbi:hypothetical protein PFISCL1PPCAC_3811 [Pristionchus fissidentatus]|uniref:RRM domain-containing protein n=1 Tax=Pristionchus fissidentatus TaxID=1538716 RepID=A0AAV5UZF2_9BILA|nr:hypothetical protein PFISCL1PPCAC_3811 [Pristionchus fissidentatus]